MAQPVPGEEGMGPLEKGRRRYQKKDFPAALSAFTDAVDISTSHILMTVLDHRAATYEKLEQLQPALRDAKRMIDLMPDTSKAGFTISHFICQNALALKIYERGLKKVKIGSDDDRTLLQSMFNALKRARDPEKNLDPLQFLPLELAQLVCHHLSMRDRVICLAVSRSWKRLLESTHKLWTTLDTTSTRKPISLRSIRAHLKRSNYTLERAVITMKARLDSEKIGYLTKTCKCLRLLEMNGSGAIGTSLIFALPRAKSLESIAVSRNTEITMTDVQAALRSCQATLLEAKFLQIGGHFQVSNSLGFPRLEKLQTLVLCVANRHMNSSRDMSPSVIIDSCPNLVSLTLSGWDCSSSGIGEIALRNGLRELDLSNTLLRIFPRLPPTINRLILKGNPLLRDANLEVDELTESDYFLPLLEEFNCEGTDISDKFIMRITQPSIQRKSLRILLIGRRLSVLLPDPSRVVERMYPTSTTVQHLSLASLQEPENHIIEAVKLFPNLQKLDVSLTKITGVAVKMFVKMGIARLVLNECNHVSGDAVDWARGQGVEVEYNFPSRVEGSRSGWRNAIS
ncbi:hypothetical protein HYFRA_00007486 [Hymenoscyphus fraxineus]|uniref:F-box domain-containing protein n=1 Tax=Hymenoscyphus fraxineus TaxID=746836 RepID=A0A9N9KSZ8_9HELO|nr:hypothetical protein HYFRA_00007486 [Hymenoscyphus fraxineus]